MGGDATSAWSSIIGTGYANTPGNLAYQLSHALRMMFEGILRDLEINLNLCGCIMPAYDALQVSALKKRMENARPIGIRIWSI